MTEPKPLQPQFDPSLVGAGEQKLWVDRVTGPRIVETLTQDPDLSFDDAFGLEVVDKDGEVGFQFAGLASAREGESMQTRFSKLPLASYEEADGVHTINLCAVDVSGYYTEMGADRSQTLFAVEQVVNPNGEKKLGASPGLLWSSDRGKGHPELADNTQITNAILSAFNGAHNIVDHVQAKKQGLDTSDMDAKLEQTFRTRGPEMVDRSQFSARFWYDRGIKTREDVERMQRESIAKSEARDKRWAAASPFKKLGALASYHMTHPDGRPVSHKDLL
jgi:hypothetical protein